MSPPLHTALVVSALRRTALTWLWFGLQEELTIGDPDDEFGNSGRSRWKILFKKLAGMYKIQNNHSIIYFFKNCVLCYLDCFTCLQKYCIQFTKSKELQHAEKRAMKIFLVSQTNNYFSDEYNKEYGFKVYLGVLQYNSTDSIKFETLKRY